MPVVTMYVVAASRSVVQPRPGAGARRSSRTAPTAITTAASRFDSIVKYMRKSTVLPQIPSTPMLRQYEELTSYWLATATSTVRALRRRMAAHMKRTLHRPTSPRRW